MSVNTKSENLIQNEQRKHKKTSIKLNKKNIILLFLIIYLIDLSKNICVNADNNSNKLSENVNSNNDLTNNNLLNANLNKKFKDHDDDHDDDDDDHDKLNKETLHHKKGEKDDDDDSSEEEKSKHNVNKFNFIHAFFASISVIVVSEIGDKTFFIAAIMAMKHSRCIVYTGAMLALGLMTLLSALLGNIVTKVIPRVYTYYLSSLLFAFFGFKMLREGLQMSKDENTDEEYEEAQQSLRKSEEEENLNSSKNLEAGLASGTNTTGQSEDNCKWFNITRKFVVSLRKYISPIFLQALILTFLAEWGDRSQISTIILGARENMIGTIIGGTIGHAICTGMAVIGGRFIAQRISVRTVTLCGAFVFIFFALSAFVIDPEAD